MTRELNRLTLVIILAFGIIAISTFFWTIIQRDSLLARDDNPRKVLAELNVQRGTIYDRHGNILAYTQPADDPALGPQRIYPHPEVVSAVGHYSYKYGQAALEEGFDTLLRGDGLRDLQTELIDNLYNQPIIGGDVQSTLDLDLQIALHQAMEGYTGAALIAHVPSGEVLAMVSLPDYDPNRENILRILVGDNGEESTEQVDPAEIDTRLLNRVTTGHYQPGGALQTILLSTLLAGSMSPDQTVTIEDMTLTQPSLTLTCTLDPSEILPSALRARPEQRTLSLAEAYRYGCPTPFVNAVGSTISLVAFEDVLRAAGFDQAPHLGGFLLPDEPPIFLPISDDPAQLAPSAAGQGTLTVTPLHMAQVMAAVLNDGNGIPLHLASATRYPPDAAWEPVNIPPSQLALMQPRIAQQIEGILRTESFSADAPIYGHVARAYAGNRQYVWFLGWTPLDDGTEVMIALVLEAHTLAAQEAIAVAVSVLSKVTP
jgi:peptidoglycan glycosyltransferase